ncbi:hypothetical protein [Arachidicoccus ginsenosidivorans]|uniref:hypothetical protein n=1 Tax=Arachidicoccus ginsenosidivorans TaxID=496057 RepID=UPI001CEF7776|nr:hypothetical protein [Arachidicoccus ginsenosidivorans]
MGLIIPVIADLVAELKHIPINQASTYGAYLLSAFAVVQFLCAPIIGNLSDKYGRRPILLLSLLDLVWIILFRQYLQPMHYYFLEEWWQV